MSLTTNSVTPAGQQSPSSGGLLSGGRRPMPGPQHDLPKRRSKGLILLAALLVLILGLAGAAWGLQAGQKSSVLGVSHAIAKGQVIQRDDLTSLSVAGASGTIPVGDVSSVVGKTAAVDIVSGQLITKEMITSAAVPSAGEATVGLALEPTRVPSAGLQPGDVVDVIATPASDGGQVDTKTLDSPVVLADNAEVYSTSASGGGAFTEGQENAAVTGSLVLVTLVVDDSDAARISAYSTAGRVAVVETAPPGATESSTSGDS